MAPRVGVDVRRSLPRSSLSRGGAGFAVAVGLRVNEQRHHPIVEHYARFAAVVVTATETPRSLARPDDVPDRCSDSRE